MPPMPLSLNVCGVYKNIEIMNERCRICLQYQQNVVSLQLIKKGFGTDLTIADQINSFCQLDVLQYGSKMICLSCAEKSHIAYMFLQDCKRSTEILLEEFNVIHGPRIYFIRPEFEDPEYDNVMEESNCNLEPEIEIDAFRREQEQTDSKIFIEEFNWDQKPEIQPRGSPSDLDRQSVVHEEVSDKTASRINKRKNIIIPAPTLSCEYCPKKYKQRPAYLVHLSKHRENNGTVEQSVMPKRRKSTNNHGVKKTYRKSIPGNDVLIGNNAMLVEQTEPPNGLDLSLQSRISQINVGKTASETIAKKRKKPFPCNFCMHFSVSRVAQLAHERTHRGPYACRFCELVPQTLKELKQHQKEAHISEACYICDTCGKAIFDKKNMEKHQNMHAGIKPHMCNFCGSAFTFKRNLTNHLRIHTGEKKYTCFTCGKAFIQLSSLRSHEDVHNVEKKYTCEICGVKFFRGDALRQHRREKHAEQNTVFSCEFCPKQFQRRNHFWRHKQTHTAERRHVCGVCGKCFLRRYSLRVHERVHTKERPYKCELCDKTFTQAHCMRSHMALHGEKKSIQNATIPARDLQEEELATVSSRKGDVGNTSDEKIL